MIALPDGHFAIRTDEVGVTALDKGVIAVQVTAIEYQSTDVSQSWRIADDQEVTALVKDQDFFSNPHHPGDQIGLHWDANNLHKLTA